ncbi:hypothetical protein METBISCDRAFT_21910 [Metschnikowia bicuspidata]|uniref:Uncharacterized protein n=1 Tax=Metschnikowia bicuspidata TaxID=27322 RepID=A0A4P9ZG10_9ASCO|nr:hypothetical protein METBISCDRAFT_21910 [Metschnikowia bicuspidata]
MPRVTASQISLSDSLCGVLTVSNPRFVSGVPRRVGLTASLSASTDCRRPSYYFVPHAESRSRTPRKPMSDHSETFFEASKDSDDGALVVLTPFDVVESRLSSATATSVYSSKGSDLNTKPPYLLERKLVSSSTIISSTEIVQQRPYSSPLPDLSEVPAVTSTRPRLGKSGFSASVSHLEGPAALFTLSRTKTRYYNPKEKKERQQLRKKLYEENNDDDAILFTELNLFNVPVIKKHHEIYTEKQSSKSSIFSRDDIVKVDDSNYNAFKHPMKPCPLHGLLSQSRVTRTGSDRRDSSESVTDDTSFSNLHMSSSHSIDTDEEVSRIISDFYELRSKSYLKLVRASRESHIYNLPNYIRSQISIEDINLVSPEKLDVIDQSRPINLPPKSTDDISRHMKEIKRVLKGFEASTKSQSLNRQRNNESLVSVQQAWNKVLQAADSKELAHVLNSEKENLRSIVWLSHINDSLTFAFFYRTLLLGLGEEWVAQYSSEFAAVEQTHQALSERIKATKKVEFDAIIAHVMTRPLIRNFFYEVKSCAQTDFSYSRFVEDFRHLLYLKSLSQGGLRKHHQTFLIPAFLILFRAESIRDVYLMIEMFDAEILLEKVFVDLAKRLSLWTNLLSMSYSSVVYKTLCQFSTLEEFESLHSSSIFELILQLNDRLPLSRSAPSTPIVSTGSYLAQKWGESQNDVSYTASTTSHSSKSLVSSVIPFSVPISSSYQLLLTFLQLLVIYSRSWKRDQNYVKLMESFLLTIYDSYHIGWNNSEELIKSNQSIRLNHSNDQWANLESFTTKWKYTFKKM